MSRPRKWELEALDPTDPTGVKRRTVWIDQGTIQFITGKILTSRFYRIQCVQDVLSEPEVVVDGWNREGYGDGSCYIGRPPDRPRDGITLPPRPRMCFFAFVLPNGKIEEWRWEEFRLGSEDDFRKQFGEHWRQSWPQTGLK